MQIYTKEIKNLHLCPPAKHFGPHQGPLDPAISAKDEAAIAPNLQQLQPNSSSPISSKHTALSTPASTL